MPGETVDLNLKIFCLFEDLILSLSLQLQMEIRAFKVKDSTAYRMTRMFSQFTSSNLKADI